MHDVQTRVQLEAETGAEANVFTRDDTFFGVCEALGQDFGFSPNWLRAALGIGLIWNGFAAVAIYLALGVAVMASRLLFPRAPRGSARASRVKTEAAPLKGDNESVADVLAVAA